MKRSIMLGLALSAAVAATPTLAAAAEADRQVLTGAEAFGNDSKPGLWRLIKPADLPKPFATDSASNAPKTIARPANAKPEVPKRFKFEMVKDGFKGPRVIRLAPNGDLFVADSEANEVHVLRMKDGSAKPVQDSVFASGLNQPYGIAFYPLADPQWVYVANADSIVRFPYKRGDVKASVAKPEVIVTDIPSNHHWTRDIVFSPDGKTLYLSVGSGSNIAENEPAQPEGGVDQWAKSQPLGLMWGDEKDRAAVLAFDPDGKNRRVVATGIRNCSGMTIRPGSSDLWCVTNERDGLGDNLPSDYATRVEAGKFYGWPWYYIGGNEDPRPHLKGKRPDLADKVTVPDVLFQAHSAPLNLVFYQGSMFPAEYKGDAFATMHGSWNRGNRTGYKVVRLKFDNGKPTGEYEDFMTGFRSGADDVWGRPVGVAVAHDGSLIVTEDGSGSIWRISHAMPNPS
ncbi:sorbosone dehydrogenase family protein [soil metagenome]